MEKLFLPAEQMMPLSGKTVASFFSTKVVYTPSTPNASSYNFRCIRKIPTCSSKEGA